MDILDSYIRPTLVVVIVQWCPKWGVPTLRGARVMFGGGVLEKEIKPCRPSADLMHIYMFLYVYIYTCNLYISINVVRDNYFY
jgi:hypothetical protein